MSILSSPAMLGGAALLLGIAAPLLHRRLAQIAACRRTAAARAARLAPLRDLKAAIVGGRGEAAVAAALYDYGCPALHDLVLSDERGLTQIDHVALAPGGILVIETKTLRGVVRGALDDREWVQTAGTQRIRFQNPLRQNYRHVRAVARAVADPGIPVRGYVVSAGPAQFAGELVNAVVPLDQVAALFACGGSIDRTRLEAAWQRLCGAGSEAPFRRWEHEAQVTMRAGRAAPRRFS